ncbi:MAG: hypothetical protein N4A43_02895 [Alphaproteobacteria bacterium]|jgi:hypothetical protein|nr:hypothetical protein [Alphaproteobacteria bacterium]
MVSRKLGQFWGIIFIGIVFIPCYSHANNDINLSHKEFEYKYMCPYLLETWDEESKTFICDNKNEKKTLENLLENIKTLNSKLLYSLGEIYSKGYLDSEENDYQEHIQISITYYKMSIDKGNPFAMYQLGKIYDSGLGVKENNEQALYYYKMCEVYPQTFCAEKIDMLINPDNPFGELAMNRHLEFLKTAKCQLDSDEWVNECTGIYSSTIAMNECIKAEAEKCTEKWLYFVKNKDVLESQKKDIQKKCREQTDFSGTIGTVNASFCVLDEIKNKIKGLQKL